MVELLREPPASRPRAVRVNGADTDEFAADVAAVAGLELAAIVLPKATPEAVAALGAEGPPVVAIVETAQGVRLAYEIASSPRVVALVLGAADLGAQLWLEPRADNQELLYARSKLVVDSAAAERRGPFDVVHLDVADDAGLEAEALLARTLGLRGKVCIHPRQVAVVNRVFAAERGRARVGTRRAERLRRGGARRPRRARRARRARRQGARAAGRAHPRARRTEAPMATDTTARAAPKEWRGRFYEDIDVGDVYAGRLGRTITETDNVWFTCLTMNTNQMHFNVPYAERSRFGKPLVNSGFTIALVLGMSVPDTSENAAANLELDRRQAAEPGVRRRHALGRERDPRQARVALDARPSGSSRCAAAGSTSGARS